MRRFVFKKKSGIALDADAQAYITAGSITNPTQITAINNFYIDAKSYGIYSKFTAFYFFLQGTSLTPKLNGKNPVDSDAAHRIVYVGSPTISSAGVDCTSGGCDLKMTPTANLTIDDTHFSYYSNTNVNGTFYDIFSNGCIQIFSRLSNLFLSDMYNLSGGAGRVLVSNSSSTGFFTISRLTAPTHRLYINGSQVATNSTTAGTLGADGIFLGVNNTTLAYSTRQYSFASVGLGLTNTEVSNLNTIVANFNSAIGR